jgi:hypothetical protein
VTKAVSGPAVWYKVYSQHLPGRSRHSLAMILNRP